MRKFIKTLKVLALAIPMAFASMAQAETINTAGGVIAFNWSFDTGAGVIITGNGTITSSVVNGDDLSLLVTLNNTTALPPGTNMALLSFGFGIDPNATSVSISGGTKMLDASLDSIPSLATIEVCAWGGNSCNGGPVGDGIQAGGSDTFTLLVAGTYGSQVTIAPIGFKFQGTVGSFEFTTSSSSSSSSGSGSGEPSTSSGTTPASGSTLTLLGLGLLGLGFSRRMKKTV